MPKSSKVSKTSSLPYDPPFRYIRPARDLESVFGAQFGNPPLLPAEDEPATTAKKRVKSAPQKAAKPSTASVAKAKPAKPAAKATEKKPATRAAAAAKAKPRKATGKR